jgi:hypothetical protein
MTTAPEYTRAIARLEADLVNPSSTTLRGIPKANVQFVLDRVRERRLLAEDCRAKATGNTQEAALKLLEEAKLLETYAEAQERTMLILFGM